MSEYNILAIVGGESAGDPLYPEPGEQTNRVEAEAADGAASAAIEVTELVVFELPNGGRSKRLLKVDDVKAALVITDARVALACSKYDKGGGWTPWSIGAVPVALAANAVSKARASRRRRGKALVGHVRYPWLLSVGFKPKGTPFGRDRLRLGTLDPTRSDRTLFLDLTLSRQHAASDLAQDITARAAGYQLRQGDGELDGDRRERLSALLEPMTLTPDPKQFVGYTL